MPAGIVTRSVRLRSVRPSPLHVSQGVSTILPSPWQRGQALTLTIWPSIVWRTLRTSPRPSHCGQVIGLGARLRAVAAAGLARLEDAELDLLLGALDRLLEGDPQVVAQVGARLRPAASRGTRRRPPPPKNASKMSEKPPNALEPGAGAAGAVDAGPPEHVVALAALRIATGPGRPR